MSRKIPPVLLSFVMVLASSCIDRKTVNPDAATDLGADRALGQTDDSRSGQGDGPSDTGPRASDADGASAAGAGGNADAPASGRGGAAGGDAGLGAGGAGGIGAAGAGGMSGPLDGGAVGTGGGPGTGGRGGGAGGNGTGGITSSGGLPGSGGRGSGGNAQPDARPSPDLPPDVAAPDAPWGPEAQADAPWGPEAQADAPGTCASGEKWCAGSSSCIAAGACCTNADCPGTCQTCNASHACVAVVSRDDPNGRCAGTCDLTGTCKSKRGQPCQTVAAGCESGTTCSQDGICCGTACGQCNSCSTGTCVPASNGTSCGAGKVCSGGSCEAGCWISGGFRAGGETSGNCLICNPAKSTSDWSNNDGASVPCGSCGGTATCVNKQLGACSKDLVTFWYDNDADGYGSSSGPTTQACTAPARYVDNGNDCHDSDAEWYPGRTSCTTVDWTTLNTCTSNGTVSVSTCATGCAGGQCRSYATVGTRGSVTCGIVTCSTSQGCSFVAPSYSPTPPACGTSGSNWFATCDGPNDCSDGEVCCHIMPLAGASTAEETRCVASSSCPYSGMGGSGEVVCNPNASPSGCSTGTCQQTDSFLSIYVCK